MKEGGRLGHCTLRFGSHMSCSLNSLKEVIEGIKIYRRVGLNYIGEYYRGYSGGYKEFPLWLMYPLHWECLKQCLWRVLKDLRAHLWESPYIALEEASIAVFGRMYRVSWECCLVHMGVHVGGP